MIKENNLYELFKEQIYSEEIGLYQAYGIRNKLGTVEIKDVTTDLKDALIILTTLNKYKVSSEHLRDIILDFINDFI